MLTSPATDPKEIESSVAHGHFSDSVDRLAVRHEDQPTIPIDVLDSNLVQLSFVPHAGIAHKDDDVAEELARLRAPIALLCRCQELPFGLIIQPQNRPAQR